MTLVSQILAAKGNTVWSVSPDATVYEALQIMADKNIGAVLVKEGEEVGGIFSERDYARKIILLNRNSKDTPVTDVMTKNVICVRPDQSVEKCIALMSEKRIRHLPVLSATNELIGMISIGDVVKTIITNQEIMINHLTDYITGKAR